MSLHSQMNAIESRQVRVVYGYIVDQSAGLYIVRLDTGETVTCDSVLAGLETGRRVSVSRVRGSGRLTIISVETPWAPTVAPTAGSITTTIVNPSSGGNTTGVHALNSPSHTGLLSVNQLPLGSAQYQVLVTGVTPYAPSYGLLSAYAGAGLAWSGGTFAVGAGLGITVNANDVALTTPGTLTSATTNSSTDSHTHAITATADGDTNKSYLLKASAEGDLKLTTLQTATSITSPLLLAAAALTLQPATDLVFDPASNLAKFYTDVQAQANNYASQVTGWRVSYTGDADFRYLYVDELHAKAFIADLEQALAGGQIICKSVAKVAADFTIPAAGNSVYLTVEEFAGFTGQVFVDGDIVRFRQFTRIAGGLTIADGWGTIFYDSRTASDPPIQTYIFTRSVDYPGTASGTISKGTLALDYGVTAGGYHEINAVDGSYAANSPYSQTVTWTTHPGAGLTVRTRLGNLNGIFAQAGEFGLYAGSGTAVTNRYIRAGSYVTELRNVPLKLYDGANNTVLLSAGDSNNSPFLAMGATLPTAPLTGTGIWMGKDGSDYELRAGTISGGVLTKGIHWDGANLNVLGNLVVGPGTGFVASGVLLQCPFDGPLPYNTDYQVNTSGHLGQVGTVTGGVIGRPGKFGKAVQAAGATTNIIANPSFEVNTTDYWTTSSGATSSAVITDPFIGLGSCRLISGVAGNPYMYKGAAVVNPVQGQSYTLSAWIRGYGPTIGKSATVNLREAGGASGSATNTGTITMTANWQRVSVTITIAQADRTALDAWVLLTVTNTEYGYIDGVQLENKAYATPYCDGSLGAGHSWSGTAHNSTSARTVANLNYLTSGNISQTIGSISAWVYVVAGVAADTAQEIIRVSGSSAGYIILRVYNGVLRGYWGTSAAYVSGGTVSYGAWHHVSMTYDGTTLTLYLDGVVTGTPTATSGFSGMPTNLYIGSENGASQPLNGYIDDSVIFDHVLTADEVKQLYTSNAPITVATSPFQLMLTGQGKGKVIGHADGLFGYNASGNGVFGLAAGDGVSFSGITLDSGDVLLGKVAASSNNLLWDASAGTLSIRNNTTERIGLTAAGVLAIKDSSGNAVFTFDASAGAEITKKLTMPGSSSAIAIGATPPTSATVGTGIWLDRTGLFGLAANVQQTKLDATTGVISAGAGTVVLDSSGIKINGRYLSENGNDPCAWGYYEHTTTSPFASEYYNSVVGSAYKIIKLAMCFWVGNLNDSSNYWNIEIHRQDTEALITGLSQTTQGYSKETWHWVQKEISVNITTGMMALYVYYYKTGSPGQIFMYPPNIIVSI